MQQIRFWGKVMLWLFLFSDVVSLSGQQPEKSVHSLSGVVTDEFGHSLTGATILLRGRGTGTTSDRKGEFVFKNLSEGEYVFEVSFLGYKPVMDSVVLHRDMVVPVQMTPVTEMLGEITVSERKQNLRRIEASMAVETVDQAFLKAHTAGSLMQTLNRLPGVSSMDIGSGQSKPVIRGLGFNRVVVTENGVKHEAQEWGADHGLEIDQFNVERVEVIKGPASLMYGANAIGGVIDLKQIMTPPAHSQGGSVLFSGQTNNDLYGLSAKYFARNERFYWKANFTYTDYADYRVPTDSIYYMSYYFRLKDKQLRNTAGLDRSGGITVGYLHDHFSTHLSVSDMFSKSGFFANAHGLEIRTSTIDYDRSSRDIDLPSQQVNHLKVLSNTVWMITDYKLNIDLGFQQNYRQEFSEAIAHGYMPVPPDSLERLYDKDTWTGNVRLEFPIHSRHQVTIGLNTEYQDNRIGGWGFILPAFRSFNGGAFLHDNVHLSEKWIVNAGFRYDLGTVSTDTYHDWYPTEGVYKQRAYGLKRSFGNFSWGLGATYQTKDLTLKINAGKSFRMPTAKELSSNGINYHMYRYEKGDSALHVEESYQLDLGLSLKKGRFSMELSPFLNYFPNYIYLNPTSDYYEAQQVYYHSESEVFRTGGEWVMSYLLLPELKISADAEYIYSIQLSGAKKGFTLPFSPPLTSVVGLEYTPEFKGALENTYFGIECKIVADQHNIVPPEVKTPGYTLINLNAGTDIPAGKKTLHLNLQLNNLLNKRYYDHTSFYRLIEVPGQGRNLVAGIRMDF